MSQPNAHDATPARPRRAPGAPAPSKPDRRCVWSSPSPSRRPPSAPPRSEGEQAKALSAGRNGAGA
eukprot:7386897-Prymnesium_polylepis.1